MFEGRILTILEQLRFDLLTLSKTPQITWKMVQVNDPSLKNSEITWRMVRATSADLALSMTFENSPIQLKISFGVTKT